ncbi:MAG: pilus assembly protein PilZ [Geobacteraceae bacterium GWC2_58_44]|nr:MAG: pilus assembly protein PilZ [Geobacteraceae bacterium GWC2_58_44]HBG05121.1 pilus assembly protein PilZ [Geobacter sp.]
MQDDYYAAYREYLREGMRIEIGIPLSGGGIFRDWAIISESGGDELLVQISRDVLPANVRIDVGSILDVSVWINKEVYTCSGIVTDKQGGRVLRIRLFGSFTLRERRQFFRIRLNLRMKYALIHDGNRTDVEKDWERRRDVEHMKFQGYDDFVIAAQGARYRPSIKLDWYEMLWAEVNLGGGGICINLPEPVQPEQLLNLEIHLPLTPARQIQAVAQVIHVMKPRVQPGGGALFPAGMQFAFLDERDRDLLFRHISVTQIDHLRLMADRRDPPEQQPPAGETAMWQQVVLKALWMLLFLIMAYYLARYFIEYRQAGPSGEIQRIYEKSIRQYRHQGQ